MARMTMIEAIRNAHDLAMERDKRVVVFGEDVGYFGGVFRCTAGLQKKYGRIAVSTRRSTKAASSAPGSAWPPTG
jgi:pyruvate/2-oxoglutarate/acetoin dehydrogenase E1 component